MIYVVATLTIKPETRAEFIAAATACIKETRKEPGNIAYDLHESVTDHTKMVFAPAIRGKTDQFLLRFRKPRGAK